MRWFYHFSPLKLRKIARNTILITACFCAEICIAAFIVLIFNFLTARNYDVIFQMLMIVCCAILTGMLICFGTAMVVWKKINRKSRYTYVDIQLKTAIYSSYAGEYRVSGEKVIIRDIYYIPFGSLTGAQVAKNGKNVIVAGKIRHYCMNSENLGYHVKDGEVVFDRELLNESGFESLEEVRIPAVFGKPERLCKAFEEGRARFEEIPAPKPYVFKEADFIRRRAKPRVMPEDFNYTRKW
ncbi:MAG: hypothetical protein IKK42_05855 [Oscillospiraceae bacterium]|nr:hypothetical protein [Oscillospiraceae bacterium]